MLKRNAFLLLFVTLGIALGIVAGYYIGNAGLLMLIGASLLGLLGHAIDSSRYEHR